MPGKELVGASNIPLILTILQDGESYGYEIIKKVRDYSEGTLEWTDAMLYPVLHRMQRENLIAARWEVLDNGRKRKYYKITPAGLAVLEEKKADWIAVMKMFQNMWDLKPSV